MFQLEAEACKLNEAKPMRRKLQCLDRFKYPHFELLEGTVSGPEPLLCLGACFVFADIVNSIEKLCLLKLRDRG